MKRTLVLSALAVPSTLALAACGETTESGNTDATTSATSPASGGTAKSRLPRCR